MYLSTLRSLSAGFHGKYEIVWATPRLWNGSVEIQEVEEQGGGLPSEAMDPYSSGSFRDSQTARAEVFCQSRSVYKQVFGSANVKTGFKCKKI